MAPMLTLVMDESSTSSVPESTMEVQVYNEQNEGQTKLYPNPATDVVNMFIAEKTGVASLTVFDHTGRTLFKKDYQLKSSSNIQIDVSNYSPGILFFIYQHDGKRSIHKIMKK